MVQDLCHFLIWVPPKFRWLRWFGASPQTVGSPHGLGGHRVGAPPPSPRPKAIKALKPKFIDMHNKFRSSKCFSVPGIYFQVIILYLAPSTGAVRSYQDRLSYSTSVWDQNREEDGGSQSGHHDRGWKNPPKRCKIRPHTKGMMLANTKIQMLHFRVSGYKSIPLINYTPLMSVQKRQPS